MELNEWFNEALIKILGSILSLALTAIGIYGKEFLRKKGILQELESKKEIVAIVVKFVEQAYTDLHGQDKVDKARENIVEWLNNVGLKITEVELNSMIDSAVKDMNQTFDSENKSANITLSDVVL